MRRRSFLSALIAGCAAPLLESTSPELAIAAEPQWSKGDYLYCDAALLSKHWGVPLTVAKMRLTRKVNEGAQTTLERELVNARDAMRSSSRFYDCQYYKNGYTYNDVDHLATLWGIDTFDAKSKVNVMIFNGERRKLADLIARANKKALASGQIYLEHFNEGSYQYCDAVILSHTWGVTPKQAKSTIGEKLHLGQERVIKRALSASRARLQHKAETLCPYWDHDYSFSDVDALAALWNVEIGQAKARVAHKLFQGEYKVLSTQVKVAYTKQRNSRQAHATRQLGVDDLHKFYNFGYSYCDSVVLAQLWQTSPYEAKMIGGRKLLDGQESKLKKQLARQRSRLASKAQETCPASDNGYGYKDMELLAQFWGVSVSEAKARSAQHIFHGQESKLKTELKSAHQQSAPNPTRLPRRRNKAPLTPTLKRIKRVQSLKRIKSVKSVKSVKRIKSKLSQPRIQTR